MKYFNKTALLMAFLSPGLLSACDEDQIGAGYAASGLTFTASTLNAVVVSPNDPTFTVDVFRADASAAESGAVSIVATLDDKADTPLEGCTVSGYSFAAGEASTKVTVNVEPLEIGIGLNVTLTLDGAEVSPSGTGTTTLEVSKDYNWTLLGTGTYVDNFMSGVAYEVDIYKAEGFQRWRVMDPYTQTLKNDDGEWGSWISQSSATANVTFWEDADNEGCLRFTPFRIGINYQGSSEYPIYAYPPQAFGVSAVCNKWVDSKTAQLAPYYYISGVGGWDNTGYDGVIVITLP